MKKKLIAALTALLVLSNVIPMTGCTKEVPTEIFRQKTMI